MLEFAPKLNYTRIRVRFTKHLDEKKMKILETGLLFAPILLLMFVCV